jgi:hypothetical protein
MKARNQYMVSVINRYLEKYKDSLELLGYRAGKIDWVYRCPHKKGRYDTVHGNLQLPVTLHPSGKYFVARDLKWHIIEDYMDCMESQLKEN